MTATTDRLVLVELASGEYVPVPWADLAAFRGTGPGGVLVVGDGPVTEPRAYRDYTDAEDYLAAVACAVCGADSEEVQQCESCLTTGCGCTVETRWFDCGVVQNGMTLCDGCTPDHGGCPACDPPGPHDLEEP